MRYTHTRLTTPSARSCNMRFAGAWRSARTAFALCRTASPRKNTNGYELTTKQATAADCTSCAGNDLSTSAGSSSTTIATCDTTITSSSSITPTTVTTAASTTPTTTSSTPPDPTHQRRARFGVQDLTLEPDRLWNYKAVVAYDGSCFHGYQLQRGSKRVTVQEVLERALMQVTQETREQLWLQAAGRTDAGVHALGQVVNFLTTREHSSKKLLFSLNCVLPNSIRVQEVVPVPMDFNVRYSALSKTYHYCAHLGQVADPFTYRHRGLVARNVDVEAMRATAQHFVGCHDFTWFCNYTGDGKRRNPVKAIRRFDVVRIDRGVQFEVHGSGFLYKQVRHMVGSLLAVGQGKMDQERIPHLLELGRKEMPGQDYRGWTVAESKGLFLVDVEYPPHSDPSVLMYPHLEHDKYGLLVFQPALSQSGLPTLVDSAENSGPDSGNEKEPEVGTFNPRRSVQSVGAQT